MHKLFTEYFHYAFNLLIMYFHEFNNSYFDGISVEFTFWKIIVQVKLKLILRTYKYKSLNYLKYGDVKKI